MTMIDKIRKQLDDIKAATKLAAIRRQKEEEEINKIITTSRQSVANILDVLVANALVTKEQKDEYLKLYDVASIDSAGLEHPVEVSAYIRDVLKELKLQDNVKLLIRNKCRCTSYEVWLMDVFKDDSIKPVQTCYGKAFVIPDYAKTLTNALAFFEKQKAAHEQKLNAYKLAHKEELQLYAKFLKGEEAFNEIDAMEWNFANGDNPLYTNIIKNELSKLHK